MEREGRRGTNVLMAILIIIILCIIGFLIWWFGFRSTNNNSGSSQNQAAANTAKKAQIKSNWIAFFNGQTPASQKVNLLQNGQEFSQIIQADSQIPAAKATSATVSNVELNGANSASVTYTVSINKQPALSDQKGEAVFTNGAWKVSDDAFCGLLKLSGTVPPICPGAGGSGSSTTPGQAQPAGQGSANK